MSEVTHPACAVCGRRLLAGERPSTYFTRDGTEATVCELCKARAEAAGWMRPEEADALRASGGVRERRRPRGQVLGGLLSRLPAGAPEPRGGDSEDGEGERPARRAARPAAPAQGSGGDAGPATVADALSAFNSSDHRRTVAGLSRTLGPPRASGLAVKTKGGDAGVRLTVAWELTWYQWEIGPGQRGLEVRESGKGETIDQLRSADRTWNLMVDTDGTLEQRSAPIAGGEEEGA